MFDDGIGTNLARGRPVLGRRLGRRTSGHGQLMAYTLQVVLAFGQLLASV